MYKNVDFDNDGTPSVPNVPTTPPDVSLNFLDPSAVWVRALPAQATTAEGVTDGSPLRVNSPSGPMDSVFLDLRDQNIVLNFNDFDSLYLHYNIDPTPASVEEVNLWFVSDGAAQFTFSNFPVFPGATILFAAEGVGVNFPYSGKISLADLVYTSEYTHDAWKLTKDYALMGVLVQVVGTGRVVVNSWSIGP
jgi:hypothetical protein